MKTIESLINASKKVYVKMSSDEICKQFFTQAEREGFTFGGRKPSEKHSSDLIAVLPDKTICYVGTIGRIASRSGAENVFVVENAFVHLPIPSCPPDGFSAVGKVHQSPSAKNVPPARFLNADIRVRHSLFGLLIEITDSPLDYPLFQWWRMLSVIFR